MIAVIGAGAAGLAMAWALQRRGLDYVVLEKYAAGHTWGQHYDRLRLNTLKAVSSLPGLDMPGGYPQFPTGPQVRDYLRAYAGHFQLNLRAGCEVDQAVWDGELWHLRLPHAALAVETLVMATGIWCEPVVPGLEGMSRFRGEILHASRYKNAGPFQGRRVLVVGAGNSGSEIAVDLAEGGAQVSIAMRTGALFVPRPRSALAMRLMSAAGRSLPRGLLDAFLTRTRRDFSSIGLPLPDGPTIDMYPVVGFQLPEAVRAGLVSVRPGLSALSETGAVFDDGGEGEFDAVVMATGYRPALDLVAGHVALDVRGRPVVGRSGRSRQHPALYCVGYEYPSTEGWLQSIGRVTQAAAADIGYREHG